MPCAQSAAEVVVESRGRSRAASVSTRPHYEPAGSLSPGRSSMRGMDVMAYLLDGDPAIRWQVMRDLTDAPPEDVAAERARVATEGWGARLLAEQAEDGLWDGGTYRPGWVDDEPAVLRRLDGDALLAAVARRVRPRSGLARGPARRSRSCATTCAGTTTASSTSRARASRASTASRSPWARTSGRMPRPSPRPCSTTQHADGGWNCWTEDPAAPSSFHSTICALEGLWAWEQAGGGSDELARGAPARRGVPARAQSVPAQVDRRESSICG